MSFSFDTIRFLIPLFPSDLDIISGGFLKSTEWTKYNISQDPQNIFNRFRLVTESTFDDGSYLSTIQFTQTLDGLLFELSAPKLMYGHNTLLLWGFEKFLNNFKDILSYMFNFQFPDVSTWQVKRLDICYNFVLSSYAHVRNVLQYLSGMRIKGRSTRLNDGSCYWTFQNRTIKFYSKFDEMKKHKDHFFCNYNLVRANSACVLRFEEELRTQALMRKWNNMPGLKEGEQIKYRKQMTVARLLYMMTYHYDWWEHVEKYLKEMMSTRPVSNPMDALQRIRSELKQQKMYIDFLMQVVSIGINETKKILSESTYYARRKKLLSIGIDINQFDRKQQAQDLIYDNSISRDKIINKSDDDAICFADCMEMYGWSQDSIEVGDKVYIGSEQWKIDKDKEVVY